MLHEGAVLDPADSMLDVSEALPRRLGGGIHLGNTRTSWRRSRGGCHHEVHGLHRHTHT